MYFVNNLKVINNTIGPILRVQIRTGYGKIFYPSYYCTKVESLLFKVSRENLLKREDRSVQVFKANQPCHSYSKMSDTEERKAELKKRLTPLQYHVTQEKGTERAFTGIYNKHSDAGTYSCIVCGQPLFSSDTKYDSGCGWPAFNEVLDQGKIKLTKDTSNGILRTEVTCSKCDSHLGHVFNDGPLPTRKRFCINSASIDFTPANKNETDTN